jgi:hypothetical protein
MMIERIEHHPGILGPWPIVERQHHFLGLKEVVDLVLLESECWPAGGVDLDSSRYADGIRIAWTRRKSRSSCECYAERRQCC